MSVEWQISNGNRMSLWVINLPDGTMKLSEGKLLSGTRDKLKQVAFGAKLVS